MSLNLRNALSNAFVGSGGGADATKLPLAGGTLTGQLIQSTNGAASTPPVLLSGTIFTGGSATTTKPQLLVEPAGTTSTGWSTSGTLIGVNAPSGFTGSLIEAQINGAYRLRVSANDSNYTDILAGLTGFQTRVTFAQAGLFIGDTSSTPSSIAGYNLFLGVYNSGGGVNIAPAAHYAWGESANSLHSIRDTMLIRSDAAIVGVCGATTSAGGAFEFIEMTAPSAPGANKARIYAEDNGSGKTRLMALFPSGAAQQIAIEP